MVGVDVGFDNPLFAALEVDYGESDQDATGEAFNAAEKVSQPVQTFVLLVREGEANIAHFLE